MKAKALLAGVAVVAISIACNTGVTFAQTQSQIIIERAPPAPKEDNSKKNKNSSKEKNRQSPPQGMMLMGTGAGPLIAVPIGGDSGQDSDCDDENGNTHSEVQIVR